MSPFKSRQRSLMTMATTHDMAIAGGYTSVHGWFVRVDRYGRKSLVIPDDEARELKGWKDSTWTEIPGVGYGSTVDVRRNDPDPRWHQLHEMHSACELIGDDSAFIHGASFSLLEPDQDQSLFVSSCGVTRTNDSEITYRFQG